MLVKSHLLSCCLNVILLFRFNFKCNFQVAKKIQTIFLFYLELADESLGLKRILFTEKISSYFYHRESKKKNSASLTKLNLLKLTMMLLSFLDPSGPECKNIAIIFFDNL